MKTLLTAALLLTLVACAHTTSDTPGTLGALGTQTAPAPGKAPEEVARRLIAATGAAKVAEQVVSNLMGTFRGVFPNVPPSVWKEMEQSVKGDEMVDLVVPIYAKQLSVEDMEAAIRFYESPAGKRLVNQLPTITQESMAVGKEWGRQIGKRIVEELKARHFVPADFRT
jgi:hypothetical protein